MKWLAMMKKKKWKKKSKSTSCCSFSLCRVFVCGVVVVVFVLFFLSFITVSLRLIYAFIFFKKKKRFSFCFEFGLSFEKVWPNFDLESLWNTKKCVELVYSSSAKTRDSHNSLQGRVHVCSLSFFFFLEKRKYLKWTENRKKNRVSNIILFSFIFFFCLPNKTIGILIFSVRLTQKKRRNKLLNFRISFCESLFVHRIIFLWLFYATISNILSLCLR